MMPSLQELDAALERAAQLRAAWQLDEAEDAFRALLHIEGLRPRLLTEIAVTLAHQGRGHEALAAVEAAERLAPDDATIAQNRLILEKLREPEDPELFLALHRRYGERFVATRAECFRQVPRRTDGPLRIAYLGVDAHTALARFVPMLATHHDRSRFHAAFFYGASDEATLADARRRLPQVAHVSIRDIPARDLARSLARGGIDIAVDLIGHGHGCVLEALAWRPAALQVTWLDYVATTGVAAIDARICDIWTDPPDVPAWCSERPLRLSVPQWCAAPPARIDASAVRAAGAPVLGIVNASNKASPRLYALAVRVLECVPGARLRVIGVAGARARAAAFASIPPALRERVELIDRVSEADYHRLVAGIDLALDPLVFSGATTTLDCLHAGLPVLTRPGRLPHTRSSLSILAHLGLHELVADDDDDLVAKAVALLSDAAARQALSERLPKRVSASSLTDPAQFMPAFEAALLDAHRAAVTA
jgi:predicted O-linked N-acetylglucosamine transferase (SPINDLY family)